MKPTDSSRKWGKTKFEKTPRELVSPAIQKVGKRYVECVEVILIVSGCRISSRWRNKRWVHHGGG